MDNFPFHKYFFIIISKEFLLSFQQYFHRLILWQVLHGLSWLSTIFHLLCVNQFLSSSQTENGRKTTSCNENMSLCSKLLMSRLSYTTSWKYFGKKSWVVPVKFSCEDQDNSYKMVSKRKEMNCCTRINVSITTALSYHLSSFSFSFSCSSRLWVHRSLLNHCFWDPYFIVEILLESNINLTKNRFDPQFMMSAGLISKE